MLLVVLLAIFPPSELKTKSNFLRPSERLASREDSSRREVHHWRSCVRCVFIRCRIREVKVGEVVVREVMCRRAGGQVVIVEGLLGSGGWAFLGGGVRVAGVGGRGWGVVVVVVGGKGRVELGVRGGRCSCGCGALV